MPESQTSQKAQQYSLRALFNKFTGLFAANSGGAGTDGSGSTPTSDLSGPAVLEHVPGFTADERSALVSITAVANPGDVLSELMIGAFIGRKSLPAGQTPVIRPPVDVVDRTVIKIRQVSNSDTAIALFDALRDLFVCRPNSDGTLEVTIGSLLLGDGLIGLAKIAALIPGIYMTEDAATYMRFMGSIQRYCDPFIVEEQLKQEVAK